MSTAHETIRIRPHAVTSAQRRIADTLAMEPGGPPSRRSRVVNRVLRLLVRSVWEYAPEGERGMRLVRRAISGVPGTPRPRDVRVDPVTLGPTRTPAGEAFGGAALSRATSAVGCRGEWVRAGQPDERKALLYLHGGAYFFGAPATYRGLTWRLSAATGRPVLALDYRLAPEYTPADALADALAAHEALLAQGYAGRDIVLAGDSAGGHLVLALLLALKDRDRPLPAAAVVLSPWADLACTADSHIFNARSDCLIPAARLAWTGAYYLAGRGRSDPLYAPISGDYTGLPPLMLISSDSEILRDDAHAVAARARESGVRVVHHEWSGQAHVFPLFAGHIPEGKAAIRHIAEFVKSAE